MKQAAPSPPKTTAEKNSPYRGLMPYREDDAPFFIGRDRCRELITDNLMASRRTLFYGTSGVGKSSVLRAGVAHHLNQQARENLAREGAPLLAVTVFNNWGDDPLAGLMRQIDTDLRKLFGTRPFEPVTTSTGLVEALQAWTRQLAGKEQPGELFIILDQSEEYFLYHPQEDGEGTFATEFPRAVNAPELHVNFLVSLREDAFTKLDRFKGRIPRLYSNQLRIEYLDAESASDAIRKPLQEFNRRHPAQAPVGVEPNLVQAVLDEVRAGRFHVGEEGRGKVSPAQETTAGNRIEAPYLQLVMSRLWDKEINAGSRRLRLKTLNRLGGADQIVKEHLNDRMRDLSAELQNIAAPVFKHLVTPTGTKIAHAVNDLATFVREDREETGVKVERHMVQQLLEELSRGESRILRPIGPSSRHPEAGERYEIFHDVLAPAILEWRRGHIARRRSEAETTDRRKKIIRLFGVAVLFVLIFVQLWYARKQAALLNLESEGLNAWKTFETPRQIDALLSAVRTVQTAKSKKLLAQTASPSWALHQILGAIQQTNTIEIVPPSEGTDFFADFSPVSRRLAAVSRKGTVSVWDFDGTELFNRQGGNGWGTRVRFSPDGRTLAIAARDGTIRLWDADGKLQAEILHEGRHPVVCFAPDGGRLVTVARMAALDFGT